MNVWKTVLLNRSGRPILEDGEHNLYVREDIGLYQGKSKVINRQNGRVYITNLRIIYVDNEVLTNSLYVSIREIERLEATDGFLRSSPKVKVFFKKTRGSADAGRQDVGSGATGGANTPSLGTTTPSAGGGAPTKIPSVAVSAADERWICMICTFSNVGSAKVCVSCGVKKMELKTLSSQSTGQSTASAAVGAASTSVSPSPPPQVTNAGGGDSASDSNACPSCTFINHRSMKYCEICGAELPSNARSSPTPASVATLMASTASAFSSSSSSLPINLKLEDSKDLETPYIKFSFRKGGEANFLQILQEQIEVLKWEKLVARGNINKNGVLLQEGPSLDDAAAQKNQAFASPVARNIGIHGLEQIGEQQRKLNELVLSTSLEDLEQLMYKAKDLIKLSESFSKIVKPIPVTERLIPGLNIKKSSKLYHRELSRHVSEYLHTTTLTKKSSMISMQDLFAQYNRYLSSTQGFGTELVSDSDLNRAIELFTELNLPFKQKKYEKSGLVVITPNLTNDYSKLIEEYLENEKKAFEARQDEIKQFELEVGSAAFGAGGGENSGFIVEGEIEQGERSSGAKVAYFKGKSLSEIAANFSWSYAIAEEEIESCVDNGSLVIDQNITGTSYFLNEF